MDKELFEKRKKLIKEFLSDELYVPMKEKELAALMQVKPEDRGEFSDVLNSLFLEGAIERTKKGKIVKGEAKFMTGVFISNAKGFGFIEVEDKKEDYYVPEQYTGGAFHRDTVQFELLPANGGKRQEAKVISIISRGMEQIVGSYQKSKNFGFVVPDNSKIAADIFIPQERSKGAVDGHKVVVEITDYGKPGKNPEGKVVEIIGHINDPGVDIMAIVKGFSLPTEFPERVLNQAERVSST